jgi:hypothetical protein
MTSTAAPTAAPAPVQLETDARRKRAAWRPLAAAVLGGAVAITAGFGVWAQLTATASTTTPQSITTGTLKLELAKNGVGVEQQIANLAPGDTVQRYLTLTNTGTLAAKDLTFAVTTGTGSSPVLITDAAGSATSKALRITIDTCTVAWNPTTGACSGTTGTLLAATPLSALATANPLPASTITAGQPFHLRINAQLPDQTENTLNGIAPTGTVQGATANLTYTFAETQRTATTTTS